MGLVFWLQKQQPSVFELKCADTFFSSLSESTQVFLMNNIIPPLFSTPVEIIFSIFRCNQRGCTGKIYS